MTTISILMGLIAAGFIIRHSLWMEGYGLFAVTHTVILTIVVLLSGWVTGLDLSIKVAVATCLLTSWAGYSAYGWLENHFRHR